MFASQSDSDNLNIKKTEEEIELIRTTLKNSLNATNNILTNLENIKKVLNDSLSSIQINTLIDDSFLQDRRYINAHLNNINNLLLFHFR